LRLLPGEEVRQLYLPSGVLQVGVAYPVGCRPAHFLPDAYVLPEHAKRTGVVIRLRRQPYAPAVQEGCFVDGRCRRIVAAPAEERLLIGVAKRRERRSLRRAVHVAVGSRDAESQAAQREALGCAERLNEQARGVVARSVDLCVALCIAGASVDDAVVDAQRILQALAERFACELQAQIAVGNERSR